MHLSPGGSDSANEILQHQHFIRSTKNHTDKYIVLAEASGIEEGRIKVITAVEQEAGRSVK